MAVFFYIMIHTSQFYTSTKYCICLSKPTKCLDQPSITTAMRLVCILIEIPVSQLDMLGFFFSSTLLLPVQFSYTQPCQFITLHTHKHTHTLHTHSICCCFNHNKSIQISVIYTERRVQRGTTVIKTFKCKLSKF